MTSENALKPIGEWLSEQALNEQRRAQHTLANWSLAAEHAYADNTLTAWRADWRCFQTFCDNKTRSNVEFISVSV